MKNSFGDLKKLVSEHLRGKSFSLSGGTVFFLAFNLLMITGFCKFSFYVLKNHRSIVERDSLVRTYVDVQPQITDRKTTSAYFSLASQDKTAPAPFFIRKDETEVRHPPVLPDKAAPLPVLNDSAKQDAFPVAVRTPARPPVIRPAVVQTSGESVDPVAEKELVIKEETVPAVSLDSLLASGLDLLDRSEETVITASEHFLQEEELPVENPVSAAPEKFPAAPVSVIREKALSGKKAEIPAPASKHATKKSSKETRWVDVAELRRRLADELLKKDGQKTHGAVKADDAKQVAAKTVPADTAIKEQNAALLKMNDARQVAALETETVSDVSEAVSGRKETTRKETDIVAAASVPAGAGIKEEKPLPAETEQVAVVQDIPFSEMTSPSETVKKNESVPSPVESKKVIAGNSPDLWKVAHVKGTAQAFAEKKKTEVVSKAPETQSDTASDERNVSGKPDMIYRNGKAVAVVQRPEKKTLNWLDRQEAAVWTSMSQSDTPSVWSADMETKTASSEKARAFRVADEQPVATVADKGKNPTVRTVETNPAPEAKQNPLLLPLGDSNAPAAASGNRPSQNTPAEDGLMNKLFSFFGKTDTPDASPVPLSGTAAKPEPLPQSVPAIPVSGTQNIKSFNADPNPFGIKTKAEEKQIVPTEMRLTFKPDSAEMSVQSIKWIKALGQKAKKDIQNAIEVRMSTTDPALQNKRFALIRSTLLGVGVEDVQIIPVSTDRTPHTIVLRMIVLPEEGYTEYTTEFNGVKERLYYKQW